MPSAPTCYFSIPVIDTQSSHFSLETPSTSPLSAYSPDTLSDPKNPLLARRESVSDYCCMSSPGAEPSKLLQLQTTAAHRPAARPLQHSSPTASASDFSSSSSSNRSSQMLCCSRCRRENGFAGMIQFGTNTYYCNHCAKMTGYCAG